MCKVKGAALRVGLVEGGIHTAFSGTNLGLRLFAGGCCHWERLRWAGRASTGSGVRAGRGGAATNRLVYVDVDRKKQLGLKALVRVGLRAVKGRLGRRAWLVDT